MVKCPYCRSMNRPGTRFCENCRADLRNVAPVAPPPEETGPEVNLPSTVRLSKVPLVELTPIEPPRERTIPAQETARPPQDEVPTPLVPLAVQQPRLTESRPPLPQPMVEPIVPAPDLNATMSAASEPTFRLQKAVPPGPVVTQPASSLPPAQPAVNARPKLVVLRGLKVNVTYPLYEGRNYIGRPDDRPVDIDLEDQEPTDRVWASRQHAVITLENGVLSIEDLNSLNGTFVNRIRVHPGQQRTLAANDIVQVGTVQLKVVV